MDKFASSVGRAPRLAGLPAILNHYREFWPPRRAATDSGAIRPETGVATDHATQPGRDGFSDMVSEFRPSKGRDAGSFLGRADAESARP